MLSQEKLRVFKKVKPNDFKSVEVYEDIDYASIEYQNIEIAVVKEPTQIYAIIRILVACIVFAASLFLVLFVLFKIMSKIILNSIALPTGKFFFNNIFVLKNKITVCIFFHLK